VAFANNSRWWLLVERALDFDTLEAFDLVTDLDIVVVLDADATLRAGSNLFGFILEAPQGLEFTFKNDDIVT
jgi:hypothetical protein